MARLWIEDPVGGQPDDIAGAALGEMKRGAVAVREMVVVDVEAGVQAKAAVEHERADQGAGLIIRRAEQRRQRWDRRVEAKPRVVMDAVMNRREPGEDRGVRR